MDKPRSQKIYEFESFRLDATYRLLYKNGSEISLTPKVVETLLALVENSGEVLSKDELMDIIWADSFVEEANLTQNLYLLRKVLQKKTDGTPFIETLKRRGYRFTGDVLSIKAETAEISPFDKEQTVSENNNNKNQTAEFEPNSFKPANAFEACQLARIYFQQSTMPGYIKSRELLEEAIRLNADYAPAYVALSELCIKEAIYNLSPLAEGFEGAKSALERAADLNANSAEFYAAKGFFALVADWNFDEATQNLHESLTINPHCAFANNYLGQVFMFRCEFDKAETYLRRSMKIEPTGLYNHGMLIISYFLARDYQKSLELLEKYFATNPQSVAGEQVLCWNLEQTGRAAEAVVRYEKHLGKPYGIYFKQCIGYAYAIAGDEENARKIAAELVAESRKHYISPVHSAIIYASLGEPDEAVLHLENAFANRDPWMLWLAADPRFDNLRTDSRFQLLEKSVASKSAYKNFVQARRI